MQSIGHANGPTSEGNVEVLGSLTLDGTSGKVRAVLDENMITFESKTGHLTSIRLSSILHTHHHNSRLAPFWVAFLGVMFIWFGYRIIDPMDFRIGTVIIGGVFVWEAISVMLQVSYFRWTKSTTGEGKRLFKMAPIHHHFELAGWPETKVVIRFWIIGLLLALFSLTTFKIR